MNTFFYEALKVLDEENKNGGWEGKENGLLPLKSIQSSNRITTTRSFVQVIQGLILSNDGLSWRRGREWNDSVDVLGSVLNQ